MTCCLCTVGSWAGCSPEEVAVTINNVESVLEGMLVPEITFAATDTVGGTISVQVKDSVGEAVAGRFNVLIWFEDISAGTFTGITSRTPPSTPAAQSIQVMTDADGLATLTVGNSGSSASWYAYASLGGTICEEPVLIELGTL